MRFELHLQGAELRLREPPLQFQLLNDGSLPLGLRMQKTGNGVDKAINHKVNTEALPRLQVQVGVQLTPSGPMHSRPLNGVLQQCKMQYAEQTGRHQMEQQNSWREPQNWRQSGKLPQTNGDADPPEPGHQTEQQ